MTTPQLPPLPERAHSCWSPARQISENAYSQESGHPYYTADQMRAYALAAISTRPVSESIHEANARTLQALVDELREMLGVKEGESLTNAVRVLQEDRRITASALARLAREFNGDPA